MTNRIRRPAAPGDVTGRRRGGADPGGFGPLPARGRARPGIASTFGIVCTRPTYLALILYVAGVGSVAYGVLALGAYGVGMALSIALTGLGALEASRSPRLMAWLESRREAIHVAQGVAFAFFGAVPIWFFWMRDALGLR